VNVSSRSLKTSAFCASTRPHVLRAAGKFCENQFKACILVSVLLLDMHMGTFFCPKHFKNQNAKKTLYEHRRQYLDIYLIFEYVLYKLPHP